MSEVIYWHADSRTAINWAPEVKYARIAYSKQIRELEQACFLAIDNAPSEYCAPDDDCA